MSTKHLLNETAQSTKRLTGIDVNSPNGRKKAIFENSAFKVYVKGLSEGLEGEDRDVFVSLCENTRKQMLMKENSMTQISGYETLTMPILRVFYPKLIAKDLVNVEPIDKPEVIKGFLRAYFERHQDTDGTWPNSFPSVNNDISRGPGVTIAAPGTATVGATENLFSEIPGGGITSANGHIEKNFRIVKVTDSTGFSADVDIRPDVDGNFSESVAITASGVTDVIQGSVDYELGTLVVTSLNGDIATVSYEAFVSLEENKVNPETRFEIQKINLKAVGRRISAQWSIDMEQDAKALYDISLQAELVNIIGEQIALDIDREIVNKLISTNSSLNPTTHTQSFDLNPPDTFTWGRKLWYQNVIPTLNNLSAQIYNSCLMGGANTLACNPLDAAVFESLDTFQYAGNSVDGGEVGYQSATVQGGKWKILVSSIVPQGSVIAKYRSNELMRAAFVYAPYVPAVLTPFPLGSNPSLTILSRYATKVIRNLAIGVLSISDTA